MLRQPGFTDGLLIETKPLLVQRFKDLEVQAVDGPRASSV